MADRLDVHKSENFDGGFSSQKEEMWERRSPFGSSLGFFSRPGSSNTAPGNVLPQITVPLTGSQNATMAGEPAQDSLQGPPPQQPALPGQGFQPKQGRGGNGGPTYAGVTAAGLGQNRRPADQRSNSNEAWKMARERRERFLKTATRSEQCINKNKERFERQNESSEDPYPEHKENVEITTARLDEVRSTFSFLRQCHDHTPGKKTVRAEISQQALLNRNEFLRARSFVLYTVDISPSRDVVLDWAEVILHQQMGIRVERVRVLSRQCYLITVEAEADRDEILDATPLFLGPHMVFALPWETTFNPTNLATCKVPVWVDLPNIHPSLEGFGAELLKNVGEVLYTSCEESECRFTNIRGCLRLDLSQELPEFLEIVDPDTREAYFHPILYRSMPDACFQCHQRGHVVRNCPSRKMRRGQQEQKDGGNHEAENTRPKEKDEGEQVPPKPHGRKVKDKDPAVLQYTNPYAVLAESDDDEVEAPLVPQCESANSQVATVETHGVQPDPEAEPSRNTAMDVEKEAKRKRERQKDEVIGESTDVQKAAGTLKKVKRWLRANDADVLMLQELRIREQDAKFCLKQISEAGEAIVDYTPEGKAGVALVIRRNWEIVEKGVRGDGTLVWARVKYKNRVIGLVAVHGPRERTERARLWQWIEEKWSTGEWYLGGDWNSVETQEDSMGVSPVQIGAERRAWSSLLAHHDLADGWLEAQKRSGPWFTRQKEVGGRMEQARLDRLYFPRNTINTDLSSRMKHDAGIRLSDHHPVYLSLERTGARGRGGKSTYFKVNPELLKRDEDLKTLRKEVAKKQITISTGELTKLEKEIQRLEDGQCAAWKRWSQVRWMKEGDAPSKFFFALLRIKRLKEEITSLEAEDGRKLETEEEIMTELHRYYTMLYKKDPEIQRAVDKREGVLSGLSKKVTAQQNEKLIATPTEEEIGKTVLCLKNEKSPGVDGMTAEVVKEIWSESPQDVIDFILTFWRLDTLTWKQLTGVIKLIPKEGDKEKIRNWRPLQLLNTGYKVISKLMANRLREIIGELVDAEQKGFIKGRTISDNILNYLMCQEWAEVNKQPALFAKLDFEKAYDRVDHTYLWETMMAMGFDKKFIALSQGLVQGSVSKIHVNGQFSDEIQIERGIKQGCPLAPLLFALSTQPLMTILKARQSEGRLRGISLGGANSALHNLFADDTGIMLNADPENFAELQLAVKLYEEISGAKLNITKSTIIPIAMEHVPGWMHRLGCYIAQEGEVIRYLGFPIGWKVKDTQKCDFILGRIQKRLGSWTYRMLSFAGRMVVMRYVLKAMPNHLFTCLYLNQKALDRLEAICRKFLWGKSEGGKDRIPLIAWEVVSKTKGDGGLATTSFAVQGRALRLRQVLKIFSDSDEDWVQALQALLKHTMTKRPGGKISRHWDLKELLLVCCPKRIPKAQTATGLLTAWLEAAKKLQIDVKEIRLEGDCHAHMYIELLKRQGILPRQKEILMKKALKSAKIQEVGRWADWAVVQNENRPLREMDAITVEHGMTIEVQSGGVSSLPWYWKIGKRSYSTWSLPTSTCKNLYIKHDRDSMGLNHKWGRNESKRKWARRFTRVWKSFLPAKEKLWLWKVLHQGLPTAERTLKWGHGDGICARCGTQIETVDHLFWKCRHARERWEDFGYLAEGLVGCPPRARLFLEAFDDAFRENVPAAYMSFVENMTAIWSDRNTKCYTGRTSRIPCSVSINALEAMAQAQLSNLPEESRRRKPLQETLRYVTTLRERWDRSRRQGTVSEDPSLNEAEETLISTDIQNTVPQTQAREQLE
ncbi:hypothetical protein R1sor_027581 [Riccia sorocarpa]|uniref:Reverse transcriptase n=1 Tax=Riccia sorocarpa TaxID=122646 RepID=A0ABD3GFD8_9MARC